MEAQKYQKRRAKFDAIKFIGGEENGAAVTKWLHEVAGHGSPQWTKTVPGQFTADEEWISIGSRRWGVNTWFTVDDIHGEFTVFSDEEFQNFFVSTDDAVRVTTNNFSDESSLHFTETGIEEAKPADVMRDDEAVIDGGIIDSVPVEAPKLEKFELDGLFSFGGVLHGRRADNGDFVPIVIQDEKPTLIDNAGDSGVVVSVENGWIKEISKYDEDTVFKVKRALMDCRIGQPQADELINSMTNAGILFRERV